MQGLLDEGREAMDEDGPESVCDAALISAAQRVEHYEMAGYGCVIEFAELLEERNIADILTDTLDEEKGADEKLTQLAEEEINPRALLEGGTGETGENDEEEDEEQDGEEFEMARQGDGEEWRGESRTDYRR
jgi:hypothetical protein